MLKFVFILSHLFFILFFLCLLLPPFGFTENYFISFYLHYWILTILLCFIFWGLLWSLQCTSLIYHNLPLNNINYFMHIVRTLQQHTSINSLLTIVLLLYFLLLYVINLMIYCYFCFKQFIIVLMFISFSQYNSTSRYRS